MVSFRDRAPPAEPPSGGSETARLTYAIEALTKSIDRLDIEIRTLRGDARSDFRLLFGAIITTALGLAAMIAKVGHWY